MASTVWVNATPLAAGSGLIVNYFSIRCNICTLVFVAEHTAAQFAASVLIMAEATFICDAVFSIHSNHVRAAVNSHGTRSSGRHQWFSMNVWAEMINDHLIGLYTRSVTRLPRWTKVPHFLPAGIAWFTAVCTSKCSRHHVVPARRSTSSFFQDCT